MFTDEMTAYLRITDSNRRWMTPVLHGIVSCHAKKKNTTNVIQALVESYWFNQHLYVDSRRIIITQVQLQNYKMFLTQEGHLLPQHTMSVSFPLPICA